MVHLPALAMTDEVSRVLSAVNKVGLVVRGLFGEGTEGQGNVYQISNQISLGQAEKERSSRIGLSWPSKLWRKRRDSGTRFTGTSVRLLKTASSGRGEY